MPPRGIMEAEAAEASVLLWVFSRQLDRWRPGTRRDTLPASSVYTSRVRAELRRAGLVAPGLDDTSSAYAAGYQPVHSRVVGACLASPIFQTSVECILSRQQLEVRDFWQQTPYCASPVFMLELKEALMLQEPQDVYAYVPGAMPSGLFFKLSPFSEQRCLDATVKDLCMWVLLVSGNLITTMTGWTIPQHQFLVILSASHIPPGLWHLRGLWFGTIVSWDATWLRKCVGT